MARLARVIAVDVRHHVTQRGNARRFILDSDTDRAVYLDLLRHYPQLHDLSLVGYCLMSNHVPLVAIPHQKESLSLAMKETQGRYAAYWNARRTSSGHAWQGRFYSCPMDESHRWIALRYTEMDPVRAGMVAQAGDWAWSSAAAHCGRGEADGCLEMATWRQRWNEVSWGKFLEEGEAEAELRMIRRCTHSGRPLGPADFVRSLEESTHRRPAPQKGGRLRQPVVDERQESLAFAENQ